MTDRYDLLIRNARDATGAEMAIGIKAGTIAAIGGQVSGRGPEYDARGQTFSVGLHDHHLHLLATAARMESVDLAGCTTPDQIAARLRNSAGAVGSWVRAVDYDERAAGLPDRHILDEWLPTHPLRLQDRTGTYWILNSEAISRLSQPPFPDCVELGSDGFATGRIRRGDAWLRERIGATPPPLAALGKKLARWGVTGVTDASASNGPAEAMLLAGAMPQRLVLMGSEALPAGEDYELGPVKLLLDEDDLPPLDAVAGRIVTARKLRRNVAAHCVTLGELLFYLEALTQAGGAQPGDRIEHGGMIAESLIADISAAGLIVVTQPNFIHDRGDRYCAQMEPDELGDLYRLASLQRRGVDVRGGSDAPYGDIDPWTAIRAATNRQTREGRTIGKGEAIHRSAALALYQSCSLAVGVPADLFLYKWLGADDARATVGLTLIGGEIVWQA